MGVNLQRDNGGMFMSRTLQKLFSNLVLSDGGERGGGCGLQATGYRISNFEFRISKWLPSAALALTLALTGAAQAQLTLTGTNYVQNFDSVASGLPSGWSVRTNATSSTRGTAVTFATTAAAWNSTTGSFRNSSSATGSTSADASTVQSANTNRAIAMRQTGSYGDPGAAFELEIGNTTGKNGFSLQIKHQMLDVQTRSTAWSVQHSTNGTSWTTAGTFSDPGAWGSTNATYNFGAALDNVSTPVYIRIVALSGSTSTGSRDTYGIDDFTLAWSGTPTPFVSATGSVSGLFAPLNTASEAGTFSVSGAYLTQNLTVKATLAP